MKGRLDRLSIINLGSKKVGQFLQEDVYYIPEYQRGYSWEEDQLEDLWMDLTQMYSDEDIDSHFFGQLVIHQNNEEDKKYIIDGQQRASTSVILLDVIRSHFEKFKGENKEDAQFDIADITTKYIGRTSERRNEPRLFLGDNDKQFFQKYIQESKKKQLTESSINKLSKSEKLIYEASQYYDNKINNLLSQFEEETQRYQVLSDLLEIFSKKFILMYVETTELDEAFIIFETLNARGKDLEISDLLKNHVFRSASNNIDSVKNEWNTMINSLDNTDPTKFIRHYWNSQYHFVREKELYKNIRRKINSSKQVKKLMNDLTSLAELYTSLNKPDQTTYFQDSTLIEQNQEIKNLNAKSYYPIIIALVKKEFDEKSISAVHEIIECLIVRNFTVAGKTANKFEKEFAKIAYNISNNKLENTNEIINEINWLIIKDDEFYENFKIFEAKKSNVIRYLLRKINNYSNVETRLINDNNVIHIEHIIPKKPRSFSDWGIDSDTHKEYLNRFGNLTLLGQEYNKSAVNKNFKDKKEVYMRSDIPMTKELTSYKTWTIKDIEKRQEKLAKKALKIWKLSE